MPLYVLFLNGQTNNQTIEHEAEAESMADAIRAAEAAYPGRKVYLGKSK